MPSWKKVIISGSAAALSSLNVTGGITGSSVLISGSTGTLFSSNVDTLVLTGSLLVTGSTVLSGSLSVTQGITGSLFGTSSYAVQALSASWAPTPTTAATASFVTGSNVFGPFGSNSILSSSFATNASSASVTDTTTGVGPYYVMFADGTTGNRVVRVDSNNLTFNATTNTLTVANLAGTASWANNAATASYVNPLNQDVVISGSLTQGSGSSALNFSHAEGLATVASGSYSHAEGQYTSASGQYSHAEGGSTLAAGIASHAEGSSTLASGLASHAEGGSTQALGNYSHAEGLGTVSQGAYQHVQGVYNLSSSVSYAFIHGNGTGNANRSNLIYAVGSVVQITGSLNVTGSITGSLFGTSSWARNAVTASFVTTAQTASYVLQAVSSSFATTAATASYVLNAVSASFASTASFVNTLNQSVIITGSAAIGTSSLGPSENSLTLGARDGGSEGGQLGFNAPGGTYTSASFIDNWQNNVRILRGNNTTSDATVVNWNLHTKQMQLPQYTNASSFVGTATANLAVDSGGNIITVSTTGGSVFPYTGTAGVTGSISATGPIYSQVNGGMYFQGGDDAALYDINLSNHMGIYGVQDSTVGAIKLGSAGPVLYGSGSRLGIGTTNPSSASLTVNGNVWATSFTGSLFGTSSWAVSASWTPTPTTVPTASFVTASNVYGPYGSNSIISASYAVSSSNALTSSFALTSSYASNGGVTQLLAGANITLAPTNGLGQVTISAAGSGGSSFNTATGSYGSFYDTTTQTNPVANTPRSMSLNTTDITNGVSVSGSTNPFNTYIKTENAGVYNIQFSAQLDKTDSGTDEVVIWLRKNGTDLTDTATTITLTNNNTKYVAAWNWFVTSAANDYYQIIWYSADTDLRLLAEVPGGGHPGIPSVIVTANRVDQFLSNTGSFSGSFTGQFTGSLFGTSSWASNAVTASNALSSSNFVVTNTLALDAALVDYASVNPTVSGLNTIYTQATGSFTSAFMKYTVSSGSNTRAGEFMTAWNGTNTVYTDTSTTDIGTTAGISFISSIVSSQLRVSASCTTAGWNVKTLSTFM